MFLRIGFFLFFLANIFGGFSEKDVHILAEKMWQRECGGEKEKLTHWNEQEHFASLGIGHFIWYPENGERTFQETFPELLKFLRSKGKKLPVQIGPCPWNTREEFFENFSSEKMRNLRGFLLDTKNLQAIFIANRLKSALPKLLEKTKLKLKVESNFTKIASDPKGLFALIDYIHFKGEGILKSETKNGKGWGLLQVLERVSPMAENPTKAFIEAAREILIERVQSDPSEKRWLKGWIKRIESYDSEIK